MALSRQATAWRDRSGGAEGDRRRPGGVQLLPACRAAAMLAAGIASEGVWEGCGFWPFRDRRVLSPRITKGAPLWRPSLCAMSAALPGTSSSVARALRLRRIAVALRERYVDAVIKANLTSSNCRHGRDIGNRHALVCNRCSMSMWLRLRHDDGKRKRHNNYDSKLLC